jgi:hypothetical protein
MSLKSDESSVTVAEASFLLTPDGASTTSNSIGTGARSPTPSTTILTARGIVRGVVTALCFVLVVATGFGVAGYIQDKAVGQRPINVVDSGKCTCDCFDGAVYLFHAEQRIEVFLERAAGQSSIRHIEAILSNRG